MGKVTIKKIKGTKTINSGKRLRRIQVERLKKNFQQDHKKLKEIVKNRKTDLGFRRTSKKSDFSSI